jgi:hypothetical protein
MTDLDQHILLFACLLATGFSLSVDVFISSYTEKTFTERDNT